MSQTVEIGDKLEVTIERMVPRGYGIGFAQGLTVFVALSAPGDRLRVRVRKIRNRLAYADIVQVLQPGPERIAPACTLFGKCGGCDMQQLSYKAQLDAKAAIIRDCLRRIGKIEYDGEIEIVPSPQPFGYRSRARWQVDPKRHLIGYHARESRRLVPVTDCPILTPGLQSTLDYLSQTMGTGGEAPIEIEAATGDDGRVSTYSPGGEPAAEVTFAVGGDEIGFTAETFFQGNKLLIPSLIETALGDARGGTAFDLYCGVGLFTLPMARRFDKVIAVEGSRPAAQLARKNAEAARLANVEVVSRSVGKFLAGNKASPDMVLLDPPRSGDDPSVIGMIAALKAGRVSYVSCEPSILARDLRTFMDGGYSIDKVTGLDMFPQTHHVETVVQLSREERRSLE